MSYPILILKSWISDELARGVPDPQLAVLSTVSKEGHPHGRVVAIREINEHTLLFFTQKGSRKVAEMMTNPHVSLTFWFELFEREVMIDGVVEALAQVENKHYWDKYPPPAQIRFHSYAPTSSQVIEDKQFLEDKRKALDQQFQGNSLPISEHYCGFKIIPSRMVFYSYRIDELSDVIEYSLTTNHWEKKLLSP